ncbi:MAG: DEAD/DEAH box helicase family protein [Kiritimatiellae bacterium]|nr:DEAD/DEAH box helicase family protein [Kiritimatiellia bacterium]
MSNFAFFPQSFKVVAESAVKAESYIMGDPRAACFHARFALEALVHWLFRHDAALTMPYDHSLGALLHAPSLMELLPQAVFHKARVILKEGNQAVHNGRPVRQYDALQVVRELHHLCYWLVRSYAPEHLPESVVWRDELIPAAISAEAVPRKQLEALEQRLAEQSANALKQQEERDGLDSELQVLRRKLAELRAASELRSDTHDYSEAQTRRHLIDVDLRRAGWPLDSRRDREYEVVGMPNNQGIGYADYVLWGDDGKPLAVVEAKKSSVNAEAGRQQAKLYADCLETMHGGRPVIFYTNGYVTYLWDDLAYPPRRVAGFYKQDELARLMLRRAQRRALDVAHIKDEIVNRYYQKRAIGSIAAQFSEPHCQRKSLLVMATGSGKTRIAIALVDLLQRAGWVKRALFLADRISLVKQAVGAFKTHLPQCTPVNLVTERDATGRVYLCTYPTMLGLINESKGSVARFGVGHFDLVIIDEAHRSVYQRYGAIFKYFDALLVGLTATPREQIDKNTYDLFDLEQGVPTDAYELESAVADGYLVPPRVQQVDLKFPREGIEYDDLSEEEKAQWESLDWGDEESGHLIPERVNATAINNWLFNKDTVDKMLQHLMLHGHKVEGGDRLAKTIIFARNHDHAVFIEARFNHHYPHYKGHFARVIDHQATYAQDLIDKFYLRESAPHIAISVDMLDTGIDVPEVANLVFFKPVYSKIKFWQMIGRGTRLSPDLFGPGVDKEDFRVFDFCFNFDFFRENPSGIEGTGSKPLGARLFCARVQLLRHLQVTPEKDPEAKLRRSLAGGLHGEVASMNPDNFIVRMQLESVEHFQDRKVWDALSEGDAERLQREVAMLPTQVDVDEIESRLFDLTALRMQLALAEGDMQRYERQRQRVVEIAMLLEEKSGVPAVRAQLEYLAALQDNGFWEAMDLNGVEEMRLRLRDLMVLLDKVRRKIVFTDFNDEIMNLRDGEAIYIPKMTGAQYAKKVKDYLRTHTNDFVIHRLRTNQPLTELDLQGLESTLQQIGEEDGSMLLTGLLAQSGAPSLAYFVRSLVGLEREAVQAAFSAFLSDRSLTPPQIRFVELVIDQLTCRGVMDASALYEPPFSNIHIGGPEGLFAGRERVMDNIFEQLKAVNKSV